MGLATGRLRLSLVQLDHDGELEPMHGNLGPIEAGIDVQRTIRRVDMTSFWMTLTGLCALATILTDNISFLSGLPGSQRSTSVSSMGRGGERSRYKKHVFPWREEIGWQR